MTGIVHNLGRKTTSLLDTVSENGVQTQVLVENLTTATILTKALHHLLPMKVSTHARSSSTQAPDTEGQEVMDGDDHSLMNINQSLADIRAILESIMKMMQIIESQVQGQTQRESHSLSGLSSDSTFNQPPFSFPRRVDSESKTFEQRRLEIKKKIEEKPRSKSELVRSDVSIKTTYPHVH